MAKTSRIDPTQLIFLDESGVTTEMTRRYGRARRGERVGEGVPCSHWRTLTVLRAVAASGWVSTMTIESATDGDVFLAFLEQVLCPRLQPGNVVVMDNLPAHKVDRVRRLIEQRGARLHYLPAYSPDLNPIEMCWSKFKQLLPRARARSLATLQLAVAEAPPSLLMTSAAASAIAIMPYKNQEDALNGAEGSAINRHFEKGQRR